MAWQAPDPPPPAALSRLHGTGLSVGSASQFRAVGIPITIHFSFILIVLWGGWQGWLRYQAASGILYGVLAVALLFGSVLLHELAHAVQARAVGWQVYGVTLTPLGGVAKVAARPAEAFHELAVAVAGPSANLGLAVAFGVFAYFVQPFAPLDWSQYFLTDFPSLRGIALYLFAINGLLAMTNLLPVLPMDGAYMLRAVLKLMGASSGAATRAVTVIGRLAAVPLLGGAAVAALNRRVALALLLAVLASVVYFGAQQEIRRRRRRHALTSLRVGQLTHRADLVAAPEQLLEPVVRQKAFKEAAVIPVLRHGELLGLLLYHQARRVASREPRATVAHAMRTNFPALIPEDMLINALGLMNESEFPSLPVESSGHFLGMLSLVDIERALRRSHSKSK